MPFCTSCGNENPTGVRFCSKCGSEQVAITANCPNCGKMLEGNEKFCSGCGKPVGVTSPRKVQPETRAKQKAQKEKFTEEGKKIISGGPKPGPTQQTYSTSPPPSMTSKKKKSGCFGCFFKTIFILLIIILVVFGVKFIHSKINSPFDSKSDFVEIINPGDKKDLVVPGGDTKKSDKPFESEELKKVCKELETIFENADIDKLKLMLSESAIEICNEELNDLKPQMAKYGKAFKKRQLVTSTNFFKVYEFTGDNGETYTATLEFQPGDTWKIVRF